MGIVVGSWRYLWPRSWQPWGYLSEQISLRAGEVRADEVTPMTVEASRAARMGEQVARWLRSNHQ